MSFITRAQLNGYNQGFSVANEYVRSKQVEAFAQNSWQAEVTIFLSHSHKDRDLIDASTAFLRSHNVKAYVDWLDEGMPDIVSGETAKKIKDRIKQQRKFLVLVTENSKDSRWVPWELGYADSQKGIDHIAAFPVAQSDGNFQRNEYLEIYPRVEYYNNRWIIWTADPARLVYLDDWLRA